MKKSTIILLVIMLLSACGSEQANDSVTATSKESTAGLSEAAVSSFSSSKSRIDSIVDEQDLQIWIDYLNANSIDIFSGSTGSNFFTTPYPSLVSFNLLAMGASGNSLGQINQTLGYELPFFDIQTELFLSTVNAFDLVLSSSEQNNVAYTSINLLFGQDDYAFSTDFLDKSVMYFGAELLDVDFENDSQEIVNQHTQRLSSISQLLMPTDGEALIMPETIQDDVLLLSHMSQLNAKWQSPFLPQDTTLAEFTMLDYTTVEVPMMQQILDTQFYSNDSELLVALPTQDPDWTIYLMKADIAHQFSEFKRGLTLEKFTDMRMQSVLSSVQLSLPTFSMRNEDTGISYISAMPSLYNKESADLSLMTENSASDLFVSSISSSSALNVDEDGIKIGAQMRMSIEQKTIPEISSSNSSYGWFGGNVFGELVWWREQPLIQTADFNVPFVFFVFYEPTETLMYSGQVLNPEE